MLFFFVFIEAVSDDERFVSALVSLVFFVFLLIVFLFVLVLSAVFFSAFVSFSRLDLILWSAAVLI